MPAATRLSQSVTVLVDQVATSIASGLATTVAVNGTSQQFTNPTVLDQFGNALATQPGYTWSATTLPSGAGPEHQQQRQHDHGRLQQGRQLRPEGLRDHGQQPGVHHHGGREPNA